MTNVCVLARFAARHYDAVFFAPRCNAMCLFLPHTDAQLRCSHSDKQIFLQCLIQTNTALVFAWGQKCTRLIALSARPRLFSG